MKYNILMIEFWQFIGILFYTYDPCHTRYVFWYQSKVTYPLQQKDSSMQLQTSKFWTINFSAHHPVIFHSMRPDLYLYMTYSTLLVLIFLITNYEFPQSKRTIHIFHLFNFLTRYLWFVFPFTYYFLNDELSFDILIKLIFI